MRKQTSLWRTLIVPLAATLVLAACAEIDPAGEGTDTTAASATQTAETEGESEGGDTTTAPATTGDDGESDGEAEGTSSASSNPDVFVHGADDEPLWLDPAQVEPGEAGETVILQVYDRLVEVAPDGPELVPGLATDVPSEENGLISEDGLTYTFPIREGVTFHDGSELTAQDVKFSWDRAMEMDLPEGNAAVLSQNIAETNVVDDYTFEVTLNDPNAAFLTSVVTLAVASIVAEETVEANGGVEAGTPNTFLASNPVGSGPYRFIAWNRNENLQFEVNEDYWGESANLDLRIEIVPDPDVRILGLRAGDYDMIESDPSLVPDLEGIEGVVIYSGEYLLEPQHIGMNLNIDPELLPPEDTIPPDFFHDPLVRQAFNYTFDYEAFIQGALGGLGAPIPHYFPQGILGYSEDLPVYEQDLARAEELFREAGWWDEGFTLSIIAEEANLFEVASLVLSDSMAELNPNFEIRVVSLAEAQFDEAHAMDPMPFAMWAKNADPFGDPHAFLFDYIHPDGPWGQTHGFRNGYQDANAIADLIDRGGVETDPEEREAIYDELAPMLFADPMWIIPGNEVALNIHRDYVQNFVMNPLWPRPSIKFALLDK